MNNPFSLIPSDISQKLAVTEIIRCNQTTSRYGLILNESEAVELAKTRSEVLKEVGRVEFAGDTIYKLIMEFCDSPYLSPFNYAETLNELIETFYYFKSETLDELDDNELISLMKKSFDDRCQGSVDLLQTRELENLARKIRFGISDLNDLSEALEEIFEEDSCEFSEEADEFTEWFYFNGEEY